MIIVTLYIYVNKEVKMKILISDFDGTLFIDNKVAKEDIKMINKFRKDVNIFIISTARNFSTVKKECLKYKLDVDYFFCDIGAVILDNNGNVLYKKYINSYEIKIIENVIENYKNLINIKRYGTNSKQEDINDIIEYKIDGENKILEEINNILDSKITQVKLQITEDNKLIIHTGKKEEIIQIFMNQNNIKKSLITTVGDELDDLNMLILYNGYRMEKCNIELKQKIQNSVKSVSELINLII